MASVFLSRRAALAAAVAAAGPRACVPVLCTPAAVLSPAAARTTLGAGVSVRALHTPFGELDTKRMRALAPQAAAVAGASVVVYGLSKILVSVTSGILSLDMYQVFGFGFWSGIGTAATLAVTAALARNRITLSPALAGRRALALVADSPLARTVLGDNIRATGLRAFTVKKAHVSVTSSWGWVEPRVSMVFAVAGDKGEGVVSAEAVGHRGAVVFTVVALDAMSTVPGAMHAPVAVSTPAAARPLILHGDEAKLHVRGNPRAFLQLPRVAYIAQDKVVDDEALLKEQETLK